MHQDPTSPITASTALVTMPDTSHHRPSPGVNRPIRRLTGKSYLIRFGEWTGGQTFHRVVGNWIVRTDGYVEHKCVCGALVEGVTDQLVSCGCGWFYMFDGKMLWVVESPRDIEPST